MNIGHGFLEAIYENSLAILLREEGLKVEQQKDLVVKFKNIIVGKYKTDLIVNDKIILELKAAKKIAPEHEAQLLNYLKATNMELGLLLNFGIKPEFKRFIFSNNQQKSTEISG